MRANSLAFRLFLSATGFTVVILIISGLVLSSLYRQAVERAFDRRLGVYLRTLVADVASPEDNNDKFPQSVSEPLFELPLSGWYWQVGRIEASPRELRSSRSLVGNSLPSLAQAVADRPFGETRKESKEGPEGRVLRLVERDIDLGEDGRYLVRVAGPTDEISATVARFVTALVVTFALLGFGLGVVLGFGVELGRGALTAAGGAVSGLPPDPKANPRTVPGAGL